MIPPEQSSNPAAAEFFMTLLHAATSGHVLHLQTRSYPEHKALDDLYGCLPGAVDSIIEAYQGKYGLVLDYPSGYVVPTSLPIEFVSSLGDYVTANRLNIGEDRKSTRLNSSH